MASFFIRQTYLFLPPNLILFVYAFSETQKPESEDVFNDEDVIPKPVEHEMEADVGGWTEIKETSENEEPASEEREDVVPDEIIHEVAVGKGLSGVLKLLQERGTLKESIDWGGRNMDKKKSKLVGINDNDGTKEIRIERTDEFGRIVSCCFPVMFLFLSFLKNLFPPFHVYVIHIQSNIQC